MMLGMCKKSRWNGETWLRSPAQSPAHCGYSLTAEVSGRCSTILQFMAPFPIVKEFWLDYLIAVLHPAMRPCVAGVFLATLQDSRCLVCICIQYRLHRVFAFSFPVIGFSTISSQLSPPQILPFITQFFWSIKIRGRNPRNSVGGGGALTQPPPSTTDEE